MHRIGPLFPAGPNDSRTGIASADMMRVALAGAKRESDIQMWRHTKAFSLASGLHQRDVGLT